MSCKRIEAEHSWPTSHSLVKFITHNVPWFQSPRNSLVWWGKNCIFQAKNDATNKLLPELKPPAATKWVHWTQKVEEKLASSRESNATIKEPRFCKGSIKWIKYTPEKRNMEPKKRRFGRLFSSSKQVIFSFQPLVFPAGYIPISSSHAFMAAAGTAKPHSHHIQATICDQENIHDTNSDTILPAGQSVPCVFPVCKIFKDGKNDGDIPEVSRAKKTRRFVSQNHITSWVPMQMVGFRSLHTGTWVGQAGPNLSRIFTSERKFPILKRCMSSLNFREKQKNRGQTQKPHGSLTAKTPEKWPKPKKKNKSSSSRIIFRGENSLLNKGGAPPLFVPQVTRR